MSPADATRVPDPAAPQPAEGREANGRFAKGNRGGPGNPFARQCAAFRQALFQAVTEDDLQAIAAMLVRKAREGDLAAAKLLLAYVVGRPAEVVNPDTLDDQEMKQYAGQVGGETVMREAMSTLMPETMCGMVRTCRPLLDRQISAALAGKLMEGLPEKYHDPDYDPWEDEELDATPAAAAAPSANGRNGERSPAEEEPAAPSANGRNGEAHPTGDGAAAPRPPSANGENGDKAAANGHAPPPAGRAGRRR
jgi:hypothetical protein